MTPKQTNCTQTHLQTQPRGGYKYGTPARRPALCFKHSLRAHRLLLYKLNSTQTLSVNMVVKLEVVSALYADGFPTPKARGREMECAAVDCPRRQKPRQVALPALVEDDSEVEEAFEAEQERPYVPRADYLRRQKSISPQRRERLQRHLVLPSLSEDEEP